MTAPTTGAPGAPVARVVPDVTGLDKHFDYLVPDDLRDVIRVGSMVRVPLHGRRVGGWVVDIDPVDLPVAHDRLVPIAAWSGHGPSAELIELGIWAADRWGTPRLRPFLVAASPPTMVRALPRAERGARGRPAAVVASDAAPGVVVQRLPPNSDPLAIVLQAAERGPVLAMHPSVGGARALARRLRQSGRTVALIPEQWALAAAGVDVVVGARAAAWAPCPGMAAVVMLDEHDESYQEERTPTWHARDVVIERAARAGAAVLLVSPAPSAVAVNAAHGDVVTPALGDEVAGWPLLELVDRTDEEPWKRSLIGSALIRHLRDASKRVVCVINAPGRARLLACRACKSLQRCERCAASVSQRDDGSMVCGRCATVRPAVCQVCGSSAMANVRPGVTRLREELEAAAGRPVAAVTGASTDVPDGDVFVGTEAVLHRVRSVDVVAFLDLDAELLAPRYRAAEQAMGLMVRAARLVGSRSRGGRILVQTFLPQHEVLQAVLHAEPQRVSDAELARREMLGLPPFGALAEVSGAAAGEFVADTGLESATHGDGFLVRAPSWDQLGPVLADTPRPAGSRLRIAVDPPR